MQDYKTPQEEFWAGGFGDDYIDRNTARTLPGRMALFSRIVRSTQDIGSVLEFGANIGLNLHAVHTLLPKARIMAVEVNKKAVSQLRKLEWAEAYEGSILDKICNYIADLVFTSGLLIHIHPDYLSEAYDSIYKASRRYICVNEYFNPTPTTVDYRGHGDRLFKRDFAYDLMKSYPDLKLVDYGFIYKHDPNFPLDNLTWFLLEKAH